MIRKLHEIPFKLQERIRGGQGTGKLQVFFEPGEFSTPLAAFNVLTLEPGVSVGYHQHVGSEEVYWILEGKGRAKDDQTSVEVGPGDALLTGDGHFHSIENTSDQPLKLLAVLANQTKK